jgi:hypothetical protein
VGDLPVAPVLAVDPSFCCASVGFVITIPGGKKFEKTKEQAQSIYIYKSDLMVVGGVKAH